MSKTPAIQLRDYQQQAVDSVLRHFRHHSSSAVIVLPTGAGKSIVIAELARVARGKVLVLTHVKELVEQNAEKVALMDTELSIYSAGLKQKHVDGKTVIASVQSAARNQTQFNAGFSLVIIDECHRVSDDDTSQYQQLLTTLKQHNPQLKVLGLTATPYRLDSGYIYKRHYHGKVGSESAIFDDCIFELPLRYLVKKGYLTTPKTFDGLSAQYDFEQLSPAENGDYSPGEVDALIAHQGRATTAIIQQLIQLSEHRQGVIIFAATVRHAAEIMALLVEHNAALITADTPATERDQAISDFRAKRIKFMVNVAVLTTGFDAPHVDLIAILRPTASAGLYQQMAGRGLRLAPNKPDCLIIDYAANGFDLFAPEIPQAKPASNAVPVQVPCPECGFANSFWGKVDADGDIIEHFGRRCQGLVGSERSQCTYRFRGKICPDCGAENDIAARNCHSCNSMMVDPDKRLKEVLTSRHHHLFRVDSMQLQDVGGVLQIDYFDIDGNQFSETFRLQTAAQRRALFAAFLKPHDRRAGLPFPQYSTAAAVIDDARRFRQPDLLLLQKKPKRGWQLVDKFFDYQGRYQIGANFCD
ncbi:DEAD/DEAH box helicase family protein [Shewanella avicenniae]|uniref:DEAD/DEAH box helicase family protein n=1 Tax=Shewanella avicenniae TaxID=2814294 RepID=A0ABX7QWY6_9GAMM|nr:DEAD/DEAH box helicase family protein [Shewanella avicenniae]QSX35165.1 DEAD/DEAH box helicase family protein [Shewanella avicenniae]